MVEKIRFQGLSKPPREVIFRNVIRRIREEIRGFGKFNDLPMHQKRGLVRDPGRLRHIVRHDDGERDTHDDCILNDP